MMNNQINKLVTNLKKNDEENGGEKKIKRNLKMLNLLLNKLYLGKKW